MRILIAGVLGGLAMFVWMAIAHMATPLANMGFSQMADEAVVVKGMNEGVGAKAGLYFFPWVDPSDPKAMEKEAELVKRNPSGFLIYNPPGASMDMTPMLVKEFVKEVAQSLIAAFLLSLTMLMGYVGRVGFVVLIGVFAELQTDTSYWIWYGFPGDYTIAQMIMGLVGAIVAGLVIAAIVKPRLDPRIPLGG